MKNFRERLENEIIVFDGGTGTYLYEKGIFINRCFEELNLTNPELVKQVHRDYLLAGADVIETNTFGANRFKLAPHGLNEKVYEINFAGAKLAREVAKDNVLVAGSVGPLGVQIEPLGKIGYDEAKDFFKEQIQPLIDGGVDLIILETFTLVEELIQAIRAAREINPEIPVIAQVTINEEGNLISGEPIEKFVELVSQYKPDVVGFNCSVGPKPMLEALEKLRTLTDLPISIQPNAGYPVNIGGRNIYMTSPEYIAEYSKRFIQTGACIVGGCCGTNPSHIKAIRRAVQALQPSKRLDIKVEELKIEPPANVHVYEKYEKSRLSNKLLREEFVTLVEIVSPRGVSAQNEIQKARKLYHFGIDAINIPDGPRAMARMSALAMAVLIQKEVGIETVLHFACRDRNVIGMQSDLLGAWALGIRNILAITGDPPKLGNYPDATAVFDVDSIGLVNLINRLNHGLDLAGNPIGEATGFSIGVGVNPGAINLDEELRRLDWKVQAGAEYMITQPVFDISLLENFMKRVEHYKIPLIVGIWPLVSYRNAEFMNNEVPGAKVPNDVMERMRRAQEISKEKAFEEGVKIAKETYDYIRSEVSGVQIAAPLGRIEAVFKMLSDEELYTM
ncbi:MAG: bifunctional homocysteine S-methyltransferase/methylenetetrahydrofolate reductase [Ignavibacteria bacterium]|jgi:homocysteine S-methyltransferase|nr:bifunctional homocysteine S-methyltransferase/methylenetetrahydrofolate reductase [Ignavibacteria bacterium]MDH7526635.1 bifunctional homocysteine S-methyltransferase/methylenetetrahydrofolate reductase [Ignavibacteria bacterium]